jgi:hypothetical protein
LREREMRRNKQGVNASLWEREWLWVSESVWEMHFVGPHMIVVVVECYSFLLLRTKYMVLSFHSICA